MLISYLYCRAYVGALMSRTIYPSVEAKCTLAVSNKDNSLSLVSGVSILSFAICRIRGVLLNPMYTC